MSECRWLRGRIPTRQPPGEQGQTAHSKKLPHKSPRRRTIRVIAQEIASLSIADSWWPVRSRNRRLSPAPLRILRCTRESHDRVGARVRPALPYPTAGQLKERNLFSDDRDQTAQDHDRCKPPLRSLGVNSNFGEHPASIVTAQLLCPRILIHSSRYRDTSESTAPPRVHGREPRPTSSLHRCGPRQSVAVPAKLCRSNIDSNATDQDELHESPTRDSCRIPRHRARNPASTPADSQSDVSPIRP